MIQKLEYETHEDGNGNVYGAIPSDAEIIAKINEVIDYINSLPEEKPSENLNDEIKKFIEEYGYERGEDKLLIAIVARHFAERQKEQMLKDAEEIITIQRSLTEPEFVKQRVIFLKEG